MAIELGNRVRDTSNTSAFLKWVFIKRFERLDAAPNGTVNSAP
jgi:hypothetical protein